MGCTLKCFCLFTNLVYFNLLHTGNGSCNCGVQISRLVASRGLLFLIRPGARPIRPFLLHSLLADVRKHLLEHFPRFHVLCSEMFMFYVRKSIVGSKINEESLAIHKLLFGVVLELVHSVHPPQVAVVVGVRRLLMPDLLQLLLFLKIFHQLRLDVLVPESFAALMPINLYLSKQQICFI